MPRLKRKRIERTIDLVGFAPMHRLLQTGTCYVHDWPARCEPSDGQQREVWSVLRDEVLAEWIAENSGTRPYGWWCFDAPERRRRIDGKRHPFDNPAREADIDRVARKPNAQPGYREQMHQLYFGKPQMLCIRDDFDAEYETEGAYLERLGLLLDGERELIATLGMQSADCNGELPA